MKLISLTKIFLVCVLFSSQSYAKDFSYEDLKDLIEKNNITDVADVLPLLPEDLRSQFTLMHSSESAQESSFEAPRVILFGSNAKLILSFNGDPTHRNYKTIELIQFRDQSKEFEFRSISFNKGVTFSNKNPRACLGCHGQNPHPNWQNFNQWTGAYGSEGDRLLPNSSELNSYLSWLKNKDSNDRYKHLIFKSDSDLYPYTPSNSQEHVHQFQPNNRLNHLLIRLNAQRIAKSVLESPFFASYPATTMLSLINCPKPALYKEKLQQLFEQNYPAEKYTNRHKEMNKYAQSYDVIPYLLEKLLSGLYVYDWNIAPAFAKPGNRSNLNFPGTEEESMDRWVAARVLESQAVVDKQLAPFVRMVSYAETFNQLQSNPNASDVQLKPGNVLQTYDDLGLFYDSKKAQQACSLLSTKSQQEL